jgi:hypothetical protein
MIDIRKFIQNLGDGAATYFDVKEPTIKRWIKTGNVPIKIAQKIFAAHEAMEKSVATPPPLPPPAMAQTPLDNLDPITHLPKNIDRRLPEIVPMAGQKLPDTIEMSPTEQSFGNNFTRPGRVSSRPMPPMKIREEGGQKVVYQENTPALADRVDAEGKPIAPTLPPSIANQGWNEPKPETPAPESVSKP